MTEDSRCSMEGLAQAQEDFPLTGQKDGGIQSTNTRNDGQDTENKNKISTKIDTTKRHILEDVIEPAVELCPKKLTVRTSLEELENEKAGKLSEEDEQLYQCLVEDPDFVLRVESRNKDRAAIRAVKIIKKMLYQNGRLRKRKGFHCSDAMGAIENPGVRSMKQEILELEESIPWTCVRRSWRNKRASWRRQVKQVELVAGFAGKLKELRQSLLVDDTALIGCGPTWKSQLEICAQGMGSSAQLANVWDEMKHTVKCWLFAPNVTQLRCDSMPAAAAFTAMQDALTFGDGAILQVPLESIVKTDTGRLLGITELIQLEKQKIAARDRGEEDVEQLHPLKSAFQESDFDSGAETPDYGEETDVDSLYNIF